MAGGVETWNEAGGIFAGGVAMLAAVGGGLRWLLNWTARRDDSRAAKLQAWHDELKARELRLDAERENVIRDLNARVQAALQGYILLSGALARLDPNAKELPEAAKLIRAAYRIDADLPADMIETLGRIKRPGEA